MNVPTWMLLAFAGWTLLTLLVGVGIARWSRILSGAAKLTDFPADVPHGGPRYRRAMRAHANCVENLPVLAAVVLAVNASGLVDARLDVLAVVYVAARVLQTLTHVAFDETPRTVGVRFAFFATQVTCVAWMGGIVAWSA